MSPAKLRLEQKNSLSRDKEFFTDSEIGKNQICVQLAIVIRKISCQIIDQGDAYGMILGTSFLAQHARQGMKNDRARRNVRKNIRFYSFNSSCPVRYI